MSTAFKFLLFLLLASPITAAPQHLTVFKLVGACRITIAEDRFSPVRDGLTRTPTGYYEIRGSRIYGTDGGVPTTIVRSVTVTFDGRTHQLSPALYSDICDAHLEFFRIQRSSVFETRSSIYITLTGGDGAGSYVVRWCVSKARAEASRAFRSPISNDFAPCHVESKNLTGNS